MDKLERIVVVGGGIAGSLVAAALGKVWGKSLSISLVTPEKSNPNSTNRILASFPTLRGLHALLGIPEADLLRSVGASFTLGTSFKGWIDPHSSWFQSFGETGQRIDGSAFHQQWLRLWRQGKADTFESYCFAAQAARNGRFAFPLRDGPALLKDYDFALHFEVGQYIAYMCRFAASKGVSVIPDQVVDVGLDGENGFIRSVGLAGGRRIAGDLFIDCTGSKSVLLGSALNINFISDADSLPCDRVATASTQAIDFPAPFSEVTSAAAGWRWKIPSLGATGHGYAFSSQYLSDGDACQALMAGLDETVVDAPAVTVLRPGRLEKFWQGNCVAIGAAAGCFEPLEFVALHLIHGGISKLMTMFPGKSCSGGESDEFNRLTSLEFDRVRDKLSLHYRSSRRTDTAFWRAASSLKCSEMLTHKLDHFSSRGRVVMYDEESFETFQWISALCGFGVIPKRADILAESTDLAGVESALLQMRRDIGAALKTMPTHQQFWERVTLLALPTHGIVKSKEIVPKAGV